MITMFRIFSITQGDTLKLKEKGNSFSFGQKAKTGRRSLMQYTSFDWSSLPLSEERRLTEDTEKPMKVVTAYLR